MAQPMYEKLQQANIPLTPSEFIAAQLVAFMGMILLLNNMFSIKLLVSFFIAFILLEGGKRILVQFTLASIFGIAFQYYGMGMYTRENFKEGINNAIKADTLALISFEIGMFGWMALVHFVFFTQPPEPTTAVYWFMMQLAMMLGFCTSYPANWLLVIKGVKHAM